eukprot:1179061-Prorocentrum_minimum.AAC.1
MMTHGRRCLDHVGRAPPRGGAEEIAARTDTVRRTVRGRGRALALASVACGLRGRRRPRRTQHNAVTE